MAAAAPREQSMNRKQHWEQTWATQARDRLSWHQESAEPSFTLVTSVSTPADPVIDVGGGAAPLVDALLGAGYVRPTVLDLSGAALAGLASRLNERAPAVEFVEADVLDHEFQRDQFAVWHDRAVFHFLTEESDRARYRSQLARAVHPGGHAILGTFAADGPDRCSGLPVRRYAPAALLNELGAEWTLLRELRHEHVTPSGKIQPFTFVVARHTP